VMDRLRHEVAGRVGDSALAAAGVRGALPDAWRGAMAARFGGVTGGRGRASGTACSEPCSMLANVVVLRQRVDACDCALRGRRLREGRGDGGAIGGRQARMAWQQHVLCVHVPFKHTQNNS
jgi:hypothetical protein